MFRIPLLIIAILAAPYLTGFEWNVRDLGTLSSFEAGHVVEFNDQGQVLIKCKKPSSTRNIQQTNLISWEYWDPKNGLLHIDSGDDNLKMGNFYYRVNGQGIVIGLRTSLGNKEKRWDLLTWDPKTGMKSYNLPIYGHPNHETSTFVANCRHSDAIIVSCINSSPGGELFRSEVYSVSNNQVQDLAPMLTQKAKALGFDARRWIILAVNSNGMMLGRFDDYKVNPFKDKPAFASKKYFLLIDNEMTLIDGAEELLQWFGKNDFTDANHISFDAKGRVLIYTLVQARRSWESWMWTKENGLNQIGSGHMRALGLLEDGTIFWSKTGSHYSNGFIFQKIDENLSGFEITDEPPPNLLYLPLDNSRQPSPLNLGQFEGVKVKTSILYGTWPLINGIELNANSLRQVFFNAEFFGEQHPFLLEPTLN